MRVILKSSRFHLFLTIGIGSVWVFHGLYSKILNGIPRHAMIVERVLGEGIADQATMGIGVMEILLGMWIFTRMRRRLCAFVQTLAIAAMNSLEILLARDLLISALGMVALNLAFIFLIWHWAFFQNKQAPARVKR